MSSTKQGAITRALHYFETELKETIYPEIRLLISRVKSTRTAST
jgi:hypothetical protein